MKTIAFLCLLLLAIALPARAEGIDLQCEELAGKMIERLSKEGLLNEPDKNQKRAQVISLELCAGAQKSAQKQHEKDKKEALDSVFRYSTSSDKKGIKRLRSLKR